MDATTERCHKKVFSRILTGRYAPPEIVEIVDMASEGKEIKHRYASGIKDREGIKFQKQRDRPL